MGKTLRLGFAMGGGASLGTFNGAALTQALKLLILFGLDKDTIPFDRIEVDVMSGASAGAMSLAVMLRKAAYQESKERDAARSNLVKEFGDLFSNASSAVQEAAVTAQVVQDGQEKIWVKEVKMHRLLAKHDPDKLKHPASVLDRGAVDEIAREYLDFKGAALPEPARAPGWILGDRVLFACTLTNLSPIQVSSGSAYTFRNNTKQSLAVGQAVSSNLHRELRVFDLNFVRRDLDDLDEVERRRENLTPEQLAEFLTEEGEADPPAWCRYHPGGGGDGLIGDIRSPEAWSKIGATAVASGAFPLAFEPVTLHRSSYEYGNLWPEQLNAVAEKAGPDDRPYYKYPFSYVDGGFLNNEPLREAFRLASFMDATRAGSDFERLIVFVDPNIETAPPTQRVQFRQEYEISKALVLGHTMNRNLLRRRTSIRRLAGHLGDLLTVLQNEATEIEGDKADQIRDRFKSREMLRAILPIALNSNPSGQVLQDMWNACRTLLLEQQRGQILPARTLSMRSEIERIVREDCHLGEILPSYDADKQAIKDGAPPSRPDLWSKALVYLLIDLMLDLGGKKSDASLISIGPVLNPYSGGKEEAIALPGGRLAGFGGFTSEIPGRYEVAFGKYCAQEFLKAVGIVDPGGPNQPRPEWTPDLEADYDKEFEVGCEQLEKRLTSMIAEGIDLWPGFRQTSQLILGRFIGPRLKAAGDRDEREQTYEFRLRAPSNAVVKFSRQNRWSADIEPVQLNGFPTVGKRDHWLIGFATAHFKGREFVGWKSKAIDLDPGLGGGWLMQVDRDGWLPGSDSVFCRVELPMPVPPGHLLNRADLHPYPIFHYELPEHRTQAPLGADRWILHSDRSTLETQLIPRR